MVIRGTDKPVPWLLWNERPQVERVTRPPLPSLVGLRGTVGKGVPPDLLSAGILTTSSSGLVRGLEHWEPLGRLTFR